MNKIQVYKGSLILALLLLSATLFLLAQFCLDNVQLNLLLKFFSLMVLGGVGFLGTSFSSTSGYEEIKERIASEIRRDFRQKRLFVLHRAQEVQLVHQGYVALSKGLLPIDFYDKIGMVLNRYEMGQAVISQQTLSQLMEKITSSYLNDRVI